MVDDLILVGLIEGSYEIGCRVYDPRGLCPALPARLSTSGTGG